MSERTSQELRQLAVAKCASPRGFEGITTVHEAREIAASIPVPPGLNARLETPEQVTSTTNWSQP
jgi:hypothetical protein